mmetsp:Transcript_25570/g.61606  ORF Transcript_25570/g.61606 Transcript_25570/m.61606 type:complete len:92 (-) Transcript_25570:59-334(-)
MPRWHTIVVREHCVAPDKLLNDDLSKRELEDNRIMIDEVKELIMRTSVRGVLEKKDGTFLPRLVQELPSCQDGRERSLTRGTFSVCHHQHL